MLIELELLITDLVVMLVGVMMVPLELVRGMLMFKSVELVVSAPCKDGVEEGGGSGRAHMPRSRSGGKSIPSMICKTPLEAEMSGSTIVACEFVEVKELRMFNGLPKG